MTSQTNSAQGRLSPAGGYGTCPLSFVRGQIAEAKNQLRHLDAAWPNSPLSRGARRRVAQLVGHLQKLRSQNQRMLKDVMAERDHALTIAQSLRDQMMGIDTNSQNESSALTEGAGARPR